MLARLAQNPHGGVPAEIWPFATLVTKDYPMTSTPGPGPASFG
ncbi:hypothetical protein ACWDT6_01110 [Nocardia grenadensis]